MTDAADPSTATHSDDAYRLSVRRDLVARHYLTVPDPGPEGEVHGHHYTVEVRFAGPELGPHGYLVDVDAVEAALDRIADRYRDAVLNDLPEFEGRNPSVERFARAVGDRVAPEFEDAPPTALAVRVREDDGAWGGHERRLD